MIDASKMPRVSTQFGYEGEVPGSVKNSGDSTNDARQADMTESATIEMVLKSGRYYAVKQEK